jgi:ribonuclease HI
MKLCTKTTGHDAYVEDLNTFISTYYAFNFSGIKNLLLHTDSEFLISCITVWIHKWKKNDWKLSDGGQVKNKEDLMALDEAMEGICVKWVCKLKTHILKFSYTMK